MARSSYAAVLASSLLLIALAALGPPLITFDTAHQLKALVQYRAGESPSPNHLVQALPSDLTRGRAEWIVWWPPSTTVFVWPLLAAGLSLATAVRLVAAAAVVIGAVGWLRWWSLFDLPRALMLAVAILLPWRRYAANNLFEYSAEVLVFAAVPWIMLAGHALITRRTETSTRPSPATAFAIGVGAGALYLLKHSTIFVTAGIGVALALSLARDRRAWFDTVLTFGVGAAVPIAALSVLNMVYGGAANMIDSAPVLNVSPQMPIYAIANPALALADAGAFFTFVFTNQNHGIWQNPLIVGLLGIPGGLTAAWLSSKAATTAERIAAIVMAVSVVLLIVVWTISYVTFEERHIAGPAAAIAPAVLAIAIRHWRSWRSPLKVWTAACGVAYLALPWVLYSPAAVVTKVVRTAPYIASPAGLYVPRLSTTNARDAVAAFLGACSARPVAWYIPDILTAIEFNGPVIVDEGFKPADYLAKQQYRGRVTVCAVLPNTFEREGKGERIRQSFLDVAEWRQLSPPGALSTLWVGVPGGD